jgi:cell division protein FtsL
MKPETIFKLRARYLSGKWFPVTEKAIVRILIIVALIVAFSWLMSQKG